MTYEYECSSCQSKWEKQQKISESPEKLCPECGKETAKRLISGRLGAGFVLKGGGWYAEGYGSTRL
jgi:putative FmdB family regulatory protein